MDNNIKHSEINYAKNKLTLVSLTNDEVQIKVAVCCQITTGDRELFSKLGISKYSPNGSRVLINFIYLNFYGIAN